MAVLFFFALDTCQWHALQVTGYLPTGRRSHSAVAMGTEVLFLGGFNGTLVEHFSDVFVLDTSEFIATQLVAATLLQVI